ncbi:VOC family protein [Mycobacterium sp. AT1]|uniref:VOC family protein n=1 Tax=Mycobacterium sp. AT1 TaxID=1961706 RepID=UPI001151F781
MRIHLTSIVVDDLDAEYRRLVERGVVFTQPPVDVGEGMVDVFDDTCGNLIQLYAAKP